MNWGVVTEDERLEYLGKIATWYYEDDLDQSEIARRIGKSRSMVSRLLNEAREKGLVQIRVQVPLRTDTRLEEELQETFGLSEARVLVSDELDWEMTLRRLGRLGAIALQRRLRSGIDVAIGWGAALHSVVRAMPQIQLEGVTVLQVMGSVGDGDPGIDGSNLARDLAEKLAGDFRYLAAPLIVSNEETAADLLSDRTIANTLTLARSAEVGIFGIGAIDSRVSGLVRAGYFTEDIVPALREQGIVGDFLGFLIDERGRIVDSPYNHRVIALRPDEVAANGTVIGVAGNRSKAAAILAVLRAGYLDVLITDSAAAHDVLTLHRESAARAG